MEDIIEETDEPAKDQSKTAFLRAAYPTPVIAPVPADAPDDTAETTADADAADAADAVVAPEERLRHRLRNRAAAAPAAEARVRPHLTPKRLAVAFGIGAAACLLLVMLAAVAAFTAVGGRVAPGVTVGSVDVSGLTRDQAIAKLQTAYAGLDKGWVQVNTPAGSAIIAYSAAGRAPDAEAMADAAIAVAHSGNPIEDAIGLFRSATGGRSLPVMVRVDSTAVAKAVRALAPAGQVAPVDAQVVVKGGTFLTTPSKTGHGIDEQALSATIVARLSLPDAPISIVADAGSTTLQPRIDDADAKAAIDKAQQMISNVDVLWTGKPKAKTFTVNAGTVRDWVEFGLDPDGKYVPTLNGPMVQAYLLELTKQVGIQPDEPTIKYDHNGNPFDLVGGKDGYGIDAVATARLVADFFDARAGGANPSPTIAAVEGPVSPRITLALLKKMVIIGDGNGAWTTTFYPDVSNGGGVNIQLPATLLNGTVVGPGEQFSFIDAVGPIDLDHGYKMGGMITSGRSDHTGAIGGGICSASTTVFNAAMRAGLQIDERHAHAFYIDRYPVGLDATILIDQYRTWDLKWTNDTPNPIVVRAYTLGKNVQTIRVELWSLPLDRKVTLSPPFKSNIVTAGDSIRYTTKLPPGIWSRQEFPSDGYHTSRTRIVTDSTGAVIHQDTWVSDYLKVDGLKLIGKAP